MKYNLYKASGDNVVRETREIDGSEIFCHGATLIEGSAKYSAGDLAYMLQAAYNLGVAHAQEALTELVTLRQREI